jgi:hypothetical protein
MVLEGHLRGRRSFKWEFYFIRLFFRVYPDQGNLQQSCACSPSKLLLLLFLFQQDTTVADTPDLHLDGVTGGVQ